MLLPLQVDDADVRDCILILFVYFQGFLVLFCGSIVLLLIEQSVSLVFDCLGSLPVLDHGEISRQRGDIVCAQMLVEFLFGKHLFEICDRLVEVGHPCVCSTSLDQGARLNFVVEVLVRFEFLRLETLDLLHYVVAVLYAC